MTRIPVLMAAFLLAFGASAAAQQEPVAKDATVFGFKMHYLEAGRGEPVILLHGSGGEGARWMPQIKGFRRTTASSRSTISASASRTSL